MSAASNSRPESVFDPGLQQERTSLAWERTAVSMMIAGVLLARYAAQDAHPALVLPGVGMVLMGSGVLVWAGVHYEALHDLLRTGDSVTHPAAARVVGLATVAFTVTAFVLALLVIIAD